MNINNVAIRNFLALKKMDISLDKRGLIAIQGENSDDTSASSNGAGKSSFADAICWGLYGTTARGLKGDDVINNKEKKNCSVIIDFESDGTKYKITRNRKSSTDGNKLFFDNVTDSVSRTMGTDKLTQEEIEKVIGCSYEIFKSAVYAGQEQMPDLPSMTDKQLKVILEEASGIAELESKYAIVSANARLSTEVINKLKGDVKGIKTMISEYVELISKTKKNLSDFEANTNELIRKKTLERDSFLEETDMFVSRLVAELKNIKDKKSKDINSLNELKAKKVSYDEEKFITANTLKAELKVKISIIKEKLKNMESKDSDYICDECNSLVSVEHVRKHKEKFESELSDLEIKLDKCLNALETLTERREAYSKYKEQLSELKRSIDDSDRLVKYKEEKIRDIEDNKESAKKRFSKELDDLDKSKVDNPFEKELKRYLNSMEVYKNKATKLIKDIKAAEKENRINNVLVEIFSPKGARSRILDEITPFLNNKTAEYLAILSDGNIEAVWSTLSRKKNGEIVDKFSIEARKKNGADNFHGLSGGEKRKVRIACALALQDLVSSRASKPINLFIGDEIDNALDGNGLERLMTLLNNKAKEKGTVIIISHNSLSDWISNVITIRK